MPARSHMEEGGGRKEEGGRRREEGGRRREAGGLGNWLVRAIATADVATHRGPRERGEDEDHDGEERFRRPVDDVVPRHRFGDVQECETSGDDQETEHAKLDYAHTVGEPGGGRGREKLAPRYT